MSLAAPTLCSVILPVESMRPIFPTADSVNHIAPSGPCWICNGLLPAVGIEYSVIFREESIRAILLVLVSVNHNESLPGTKLIDPGCAGAGHSSSQDDLIAKLLTGGFRVYVAGTSKL